FLRDPTNLSADERRYAQRVARQRLHQPAFRARVLRAYEVRCCVCSLQHRNLLDAAHITPDSVEGSSASVTTGLSMCNLHPAAFDATMPGISTAHDVRSAKGLLDESDGPMLQHGLKEMNGRRLTPPAKPGEQPARDRLAARFDTFRD